MQTRLTGFQSNVEDWLALDLDEWTRHVLRVHFDPETGSPYWLRRRSSLPFDPLSLSGYADLVRFGPFDLDDLRTGDPADLVPLSVPRPLVGRIWETGGTTGRPCRVFYTSDMAVQRAAWRMWSLAQAGFETGRCWLHALPTGPHVIGNIARDLVEQYGATVHTIDMDPRWVKRMLRMGRPDQASEYSAHLTEQITDVLRIYPVDYVCTTPALFQVLVRTAPDLVGRLRGVLLSGTQITTPMYQSFAAALGSGLICTNYGNTLGNFSGLPPEQDGQVLPYLPQYPHVTASVVGADGLAPVDYGQSGRVRLTVLYEGMLLPNVLERDQALRYDPGGRWPADGVANVGPLRRSRATPEGVY
jgi:hypothetical protein